MIKKYPDNYVFPIIMEKCNNNYSVYFPDLPGCVTSGDTVAQAIEMAKEALQFHLWGMEEDGEEIPAASEPENLELEQGEILCYVDVNMLPFRSKMDNRSIKKTLTISSKSLQTLYKWLREKDSNLRPLGYEPNELPTAPPRDVLTFLLYRNILVLSILFIKIILKSLFNN